MQSFADKCDAIESLLGFIFFHLDDIPGAIRVQQYGASEILDGTTQYRPINLECNGRCYTCLAYHKMLGKKPVCPPEEKWAREAEKLRRRYRIRDVENSVLRLSGVDPVQAQAVWAEHVEPWPDPKTEPISPEVKAERVALAKLGVQWMAHDIRGDVLAYGEKPDPKDNEIRRMLSYGVSERRIARELEVGRDRIRSLKRADEGRCEQEVVRP